MKEAHTALFIVPTQVGKTHLALSLLETENRNHFNFIVIICPTLRYSSTYKNRSWVWNDPDVILTEPGNQLYYLIEKIGNLLTGDKTLFLIDDIIANETLDKCRQPLLELVILGKHRGHSLWLLTQSYNAIPNNIMRQVKMLHVWYPNNRTDLNTIHEENDIIGPEELARVKAAYIMYYLGGRGFYKSVLHFLLSPHTVSQKFGLPREDGSDFLSPLY